MKTLTITNNIFGAMLAWLWRSARLGRGGCAALVIAGAVLVTGCGGGGGSTSGNGGEGTESTTPPTTPQGCRGGSVGQATESTTPPTTLIVLLDVSYSAIPAQSEYIEHLKTEVLRLSLRQGTLYVYVVGGDPQHEALPIPHTFSTEETGDVATAELLKQANAVCDNVARLLQDPPVERRDTTALVRAFTVAAPVVGETAGPLEVIVYSDGAEYSEDVSITNDLDDASIAAILDRLQQDKKLMPTTEFNEVPVRFPLLGHQPRVPEADKVDVVVAKGFWNEWGARTGATVTYK